MDLCEELESAVVADKRDIVNLRERASGTGDSGGFREIGASALSSKALHGIAVGPVEGASDARILLRAVSDALRVLSFGGFEECASSEKALYGGAALRLFKRDIALQVRRAFRSALELPNRVAHSGGLPRGGVQRGLGVVDRKHVAGRSHFLCVVSLLFISCLLFRSVTGNNSG